MIDSSKQNKIRFFQHIDYSICYKKRRAPKRQPPKGLTLIELLMVIAIVFILLGISFVGYRQKGKEFELQRAASKVVADIERAREMAMSADKYEPSGEIPKGGYGVYFNTSQPGQYILFADLDSNKLRQAGGGEDVQSISLKEGIILKALIPSSPATVTFSPPSPDVFLQGGAPVSEIKIILSLSSDTSKTRTVTINSAGLVSSSN